MSRFNDISLDLETLDVTPNAVIIAIGACRFDINSGEIGDTFYRNTTEESGLAFGMTVSARTIEWWSQQSQEAKDALKVDQVSIQQACEDFRYWVKDMPKNQRLWGNGVGFDNVILRNSFDKCQIPFPVFFTKDMDMRTLRFLGPKKLASKIEDVGIAHHALDDAIYQARVISALYREVKYC